MDTDYVHLSNNACFRSPLLGLRGHPDLNQQPAISPMLTCEHKGEKASFEKA